MLRNQRNKIIAQNHQYFGVNNLMESMKNWAELKGKLGEVEKRDSDGAAEVKGDITVKKETELKQLTGRQLAAETYSGTCDLPFTK